MKAKKARKTKKESEEKWMPYEEYADSMQQVSEAYVDLYDAWTDYQKGMDARIEKISDESLKQYQDISGKWSEFYREVGSQATKDTKTFRERELYDIWRNYSNKMFQRLSSVMGATTERYKSLQDNWKDLSSGFTQQLSAFGRGEPLDWEQTALYDSWRGMTSHMQKWMSEFNKGTSEELDHLTDTWTKFYGEMGEALEALPSDVDTYRDWTDLWMGQASAVNKSINDLVSDNGGFERIQKAWTNYLGKVEEGVLKVTKAFSPNYQEILDWYFDSQESWQREISSSVQKESERVRKQLKDLADRIDKLEKSR